MKRKLVMQTLEEKGIKPISILSDKLNLKYALFSKCGVHGRDALLKTLEKKMEDINGLGYCLWSHHGSKQEFTLEFINEKHNEFDDIYVIMPYTESQAVSTYVSGKEDEAYTKYQIMHEEPKLLPTKMNVVTALENGEKDPSAYVITELYYVEEPIDHMKLYALFNYVNKHWDIKDGRRGNSKEAIPKKNCGLNSTLSDTCLMLKATDDIYNQLKACISDEAEKLFLIGKLACPYNIKLYK